MSQPRLGILGAGQLARMLALSAYPLGFEVSVFASGRNDPAAQVCGNVCIGRLDAADDVAKFLAEVDVLTFESEFVNVDLLNTPANAPRVFPSPELIARIQDRLTQKELLDEFKIPTARWVPIPDPAELNGCHRQFPGGFVVKQRRFGYDGYGTFIFRPGRRAAPPIPEAPHGFIAEEWVPFRRELALTFVRSRAGEFTILPLVESVQKDARCFSVQGPIRHTGLGALERKFRALMNALDYIGVLAVELFDTGRGLTVNELAPRVHNSAHYSLDALTCSQFEYHWRAGLGLPLPKPQTLAKGFAMVNLLGEGGTTRLSRSAAGHLHWYGKSENRPGRKLGHINTLASGPRSALQKALKWRKEFLL